MADAPPLPPRPDQRDQTWGGPYLSKAEEAACPPLPPRPVEHVPPLPPRPIVIENTLPRYVYGPLNSAGMEIRLLTIPVDVKQILGRPNVKPLVGSLKNYYLPHYSLSRKERLLRSARLPPFYALSYVWGDPSRTHEIIVDKKSLPITKNLYGALRDLQRDAVGDVRVWADAICICQDNLPERSAQVLLMREIYHSATDVQIWLGPSSEDGRRCFKFISDLTGGYNDLGDPEITENDKVEEYTMKAVLVPTAALVRGLYSFGQTLTELSDILEPLPRDEKAEMLLDPDGNLSLHQDTLDKVMDWQPSSRRLKKVKDTDLVEMAALIDSIFIQNNAWFERMWVVQELGVADQAFMLFAGLSVRWDHFLRCACYLHYSCKAPVPNLRKLIGLEKIRRGWNEGKRQPLRDLIRECRYRRGTDPKDKIFSLIGLMGDDKDPYLTPDYSKSVSEVYANAAFHFIVQSKSLDPLCAWQTLGRQEQLPSWVPDYNMNQDLAPSALVAIDGRESIYIAAGQDSKYELDTTNIVHSWSQLRTTGLCVDSVVMLSDPSPDDDPFGQIERMWHSTISAASGLLGGFSKDVLSCLEDISSIVSKYSEYWHSVDDTSTLFGLSTDRLSKFSSSTDRLSKLSKSSDNLSRASTMTDTDTMTETDEGSMHFTRIDTDPVIHHLYILDAYIHSLLCGRISSRERLTSEDIDAILGLSLPDDTEDPDREKFLAKASAALETGMSRRSIAITKNGYIGAVPQDTQQGDLVCVLYGCSVPVVLRKRVGEEYRFVGECYLHGFMDAEAIAMREQGHLMEQNFVLT